MRLVMLGGLALEPSTFTRPKPLLLLAYLSLEGPRSRRDIAELFWQGSKDPMQGLRMALLQLNKEVPEAIRTDEKKVWTELPSDLGELEATLEAGALAEALNLYQGPFMEGFDLDDMGEEVGEWIFQTRERVAGRIREVLLELADQDAAGGDIGKAASRAEEAYLLRSAPEPEADMLGQMYTLLRADENPQAESVAKEARGYGLELSLSPSEAKKTLKSRSPSESNPVVIANPTNPASPTHLARRATDLKPSPPIVIQEAVLTDLKARDIDLPRRKRRSFFWPIATVLGLVLLGGFLLAFYGLRERTVPVKAGNTADDADVAIGNNYFCPEHSNLFLSSNYEGQSTALRFREVGLPKGSRVTIKSALILFTASEHIQEVLEGSGFIVRGLFDSSPWLVNTVCEQKHPAAGDNFVSRVRTKASVKYQPKAWLITEQYSVDVTDIVQEMVSSPDWTGDSVAFAIDRLVNSTADLKAYSNEGGILLKDLSRQPQFVVTFTTESP
jgi:DNA-binding SARP family transcriptional activator